MWPSLRPKAKRLPEPTGGWLFKDPFAGLWLRPWFDRIALNAVARWYMPLSRAWAAALAARGDPDRFWRELPGKRASVLARRPPLALIERRRRACDEAAQAWEAAFFDGAIRDAPGRVAAERRRRATAEMLMLARGVFLPLRLRGWLPAVKWEIQGTNEVATRHGHRLIAPEAAFPAPPLPEVARSHPVAGPAGDQFWLRFTSPVRDAGEAWARVYEPSGVVDPPTVVFLHGLGVEPEFWPDSRDPVPALAGQGVRVVRPEGPWHGRRRVEGSYGGEPVLARGPLGFLDLFEAWVAEVAVLTAWARRIGAGAVAIGGISLGALTSQLVATAARHWPAEMRPDALFLVATSGEAAETLAASSLGRAIGLPDQLAAHGWTAEAMAPWWPLVEPRGEPALPPERILMVLGSVDDVMPYSGGLGLSDAWGVPAENRFVRRRGHFSAGLGIAADKGPFSRLVHLLG